MARRTDVHDVAACSYWREDDARVIVAAWRASGETLSAFARRHGVDRRRIARWAGRLEAAPLVRFHPVRVASRGEAAREIEIEMEVAGARIRLPHGFDAEDLHRLLSVLDTGASC